MTAADKHLYDTDLLDVLSQRVMVGDGAMGTQLQAADLTLDDFRGLEGCNEILNETRPDVLETIHRNYFEAGADAVETNTFGCNLSNLGDYDIADRIRDLSQKGTAIARRVADELGSPDRKRYVLGSMGPGTKLPTLGHTEYAVIRDAYTEAALGMLDGGADAILVETCQDLLQLKAAVLGSRRAMTRAGRHIPVFAHVTVETTGTMLLGSEIGAALTAVEPLGVDMIGLNCATGPAEMSEHLRHLSRHARIPVSVMPNAGLPVLGAKGAEYPLLPDELAEALAGFIAEFGLSLVGGCCGTTPAHIREVAAAVANIKRPERQVSYEPSVSSLYTAIPFAQDASVLVIGERTNANGSKGFREAMIAEDYQKCLDIAKDQTRDGAHLLDLCVDYVGRDGVADMKALASRLATSSTLPIMLDSTETAVLQAGLEHLGGRCAINSVNYEDGDGPESRFAKTMALVAEHGAAVVALTIDEEGQARTAQKKVEIAERLINDITGNWGVDESSILIDTLTFTIATGQEESRRDGIETIENTRGVAEKFPVLLGGAALTRSYVENDLAEIYQGEVHYARDAFEGLKLMDTIMSAKRGEAPDENSPEAIKAREKEAERKARHQRSKRIAAQRKAAEEPVEVPERSDVAADIEVPAPPFWGSRIVKGLAVADYTGLLDERALFLGQWGLRGQRGGEGPSYEDLVETEGRPRLRYWLDRLSTDGILAHAAVVYGYFPAVSEGNDIVVLTEPKPDAPVRYRFHFPRQQRGRFLCIADFIRSRELAAERGEVDVLPFQLVTMGQPIADFANELFASNAYRDYLEVHGIGVQLTEALAEYWHRRIREELKFSGDRAMAAEDPEAKEDYFKLGYRGARFAFGYGACPDLEDRAKMMALLEPERIGVTLSEELQLHPEQSTDAFVLHHPEAKYFNV
ncbi:homocysteine S-methyltransferase family protein [Mycobacterium tuberculosis]|uniref:homocysteine S-methyltransferase family protein n=1 Tax=Mycobacterium tuberculosis TaxID=1773 RepID=UPI001F983BEA|nr:homocysteine S-methyltransferase family protein [Mycobacterium tuberculosis]MCE4221324.1 hypothetical protein [Mycobacterium tuberculosis]